MSRPSTPFFEDDLKTWMPGTSPGMTLRDGSTSSPAATQGPLLRRSEHLSDPVVRIGRAAVLDVDQLLAQPHGDRAGLAATDEKIAAGRTHLADRRDHGRRAAGERLFQLAALGISAPLIDRVGLLAHDLAGIPGQRD